ncbi:uncharacterized protein [Panulirus ornatus]|uniref:uncharacterized protein n=1 Tax=Panulirus ornatus TaxID=150431 RepID=UPI003A84B62F
MNTALDASSTVSSFSGLSLSYRPQSNSLNLTEVTNTPNTSTFTDSSFDMIKAPPVPRRPNTGLYINLIPRQDTEVLMTDGCNLTDAPDVPRRPFKTCEPDFIDVSQMSNKGHVTKKMDILEVPSLPRRVPVLRGLDTELPHTYPNSPYLDKRPNACGEPPMTKRPFLNMEHDSSKPPVPKRPFWTSSSDTIGGHTNKPILPIRVPVKCQGLKKRHSWEVMSNVKVKHKLEPSLSLQQSTISLCNSSPAVKDSTGKLTDAKYQLQQCKSFGGENMWVHTTTCDDSGPPVVPSPPHNLHKNKSNQNSTIPRLTSPSLLDQDKCKSMQGPYNNSSTRDYSLLTEVEGFSDMYLITGTKEIFFKEKADEKGAPFGPGCKCGSDQGCTSLTEICKKNEKDIEVVTSKGWLRSGTKNHMTDSLDENSDEGQILRGLNSDYVMEFPDGPPPQLPERKDSSSLCSDQEMKSVSSCCDSIAANSLLSSENQLYNDYHGARPKLSSIKPTVAPRSIYIDSSLKLMRDSQTFRDAKLERLQNQDMIADRVQVKDIYSYTSQSQCVPTDKPQNEEIFSDWLQNNDAATGRSQNDAISKAVSDDKLQGTNISSNRSQLPDLSASRFHSMSDDRSENHCMSADSSYNPSEFESADWPENQGIHEEKTENPHTSDERHENHDSSTVCSDNRKTSPESPDQGSRSPLMSPGASPRVCRRDDVIPPPPVPPRKASPAPSPPSTPATTHRSSVLETDDDEDMPLAPPRTLSSASLTTPTVVTTPTTPTSPPRTITIVTLDPNNVAVETTTTGPSKDGGVRKTGTTTPSPLRHRPLSVPHIVPRTSKLMRPSGSNPSLSSSSSSPTSTPATTPTPAPTSTPTTMPTPLPSAPPFPAHFPASSASQPSFVPVTLPSGATPSTATQQTQQQLQYQRQQQQQQQQQPTSPLGGPPTTTAPPPPVSVSSPVTVITYTPVMTCDEPSSSPEPVTTTTTSTITPRPRTILPSQSSLMPPTPATTPSPSSPSSITSSTSSCSTGSASSSSSSSSSSGGTEVDRRPSATSHAGELEDIHEEPPYENTTLPPPVCPASARKSATDSDLPNFPAPSAPSLPTITKSLSADRSMNAGDTLEGEDAHTAYENLHMDYLATLTQEGFAQDAVIRALVITRNDIAMARDILREFASKRS